jgi:hypothetical protein
LKCIPGVRSISHCYINTENKSCWAGIFAIQSIMLIYVYHNSARLQLRMIYSPSPLPAPALSLFTQNKITIGLRSHPTDYQTRTRVIISSPDAGGRACSSDLLQSRQCQPASSTCIGAQWKTAPWQGNGTRAVWCETTSGVRVTGACAKQNKPSETKDCNPACSGMMFFNFFLRTSFHLAAYILFD